MFLTSLLWISLQPSLGWENADFSWSIADDLSNNPDPNVLSELDFKRLLIRSAGANATFSTQWDGAWQLNARVTADYLQVERGHSVDSDYFESDRQGLYSRSRANISGDDGYEYLGNVGISYAIREQQRAGFHLGYRFRRHTLNITRGTQIVADPLVFAPLSLSDLTQSLQQNLDSDYSSTWRGSTFTAFYSWTARPWTWSIQAQGMWGDYVGQGRWNMRSNFQQPRSFVHFADSQGHELAMEIAYEFTPRLQGLASYTRRVWETDQGLSRFYLSTNNIAETRFNGAKLSENVFSFGVTLRLR